MKLSVVIPTLNEAEYIGLLLEDLKSQSRTPDEAIVVDCGSSDATQDVVSSFNGVNVYEADKPVGNQRTFGGTISKGSMILFLDADARLDSEFIRYSMDEIEQRKLDIACPRYIPYPGGVLINVFYKLFNLLFKFSETHKPSGAGSGIFVKRRLFDKVHGFDSSFVFDDIHFIRKAAKHGSFGILSTSISVSDRRIRKYGLLHTSLTYIFLSFCFLIGAYTLSNYASYRFGSFMSRNEK